MTDLLRHAASLLTEAADLIDPFDCSLEERWLHERLTDTAEEAEQQLLYP